MRVLGFDPGTWKAGVGIIESGAGKVKTLHHETLHLRKSQDAGADAALAKRLQKIYSNLSEIFKVFKPDVVALEDVFFGINFKSAVKIGEARAVAILAATHFDVPIVEYLPTQVKKAITGNGRASKVQMQFMVRHLLGLRENPTPDAADALAVAICHCHLMKYV